MGLGHLTRGLLLIPPGPPSCDSILVLSNSILIIGANRCLWAHKYVAVQMLVKNSANRLPLHKVLEHPWIVQNADPSGVYRG
jgi:hypothetical protein